MSDTPLTDAQLVRVYGKTGEVCAATPMCGHPTYVPAEFAKEQERALQVCTKHLQSIINERQRARAYRVLKMAVEAMMAPLGYHGAISAMDDRVRAVLDALSQIDEVER